jgi:translocation and assembly module TamA
MGRRLGAACLRRPLVALFCALVLAASGSANAFSLFGIEFFGSSEDPERLGIVDPVSYDVEIEATDGDTALASRLAAASLLVNQADLPPSGFIGLLQRARDDRANLVARLYEEGRFGAIVLIKIDGRPEDQIAVTDEWPTDGRKVSLLVRVDPGPSYTFGKIEILGAEDNANRHVLNETGLGRGKPATSLVVVAAESALVTSWQEQGFAYATIIDRHVVADHATRTVDVTLAVQRGQRITLSGVEVMGNDRLDVGFLIQQADIPVGAVFHPSILERARQRLTRIEALASVTVRIAEAPGVDGMTPVIIEVSERKPRTIGAGVYYASTEGLGGEAFWVHRNLYGHGETLRLEAEVGRLLMADSLDEYDARFSVLYGVPGLLGPDTRLDLKATALQESPEPYDRRGAVVESTLTYDLSDRLSLNSGIVYDWARIDDAFGRNNYSLISLPVTLRYDSRDDLLDPTRGLMARLTAEPQYEIDRSSMFFMTDAEIRYYASLDQDSRFVLAARGLAGSILGADVDEIPAHRRFYAGGGGSVRGYEYLNIGPRAPGFGPTGGLARVEGSLEARIKITEDIGIVPFVDAGYVTETAGFGGEDAFQIGVGLGLRYYTAVGPLRLDVAMPLDPRKGDPDFAVYVGIGQAF